MNQVKFLVCLFVFTAEIVAIEMRAITTKRIIPSGHLAPPSRMVSIGGFGSGIQRITS